MAVTSQKPSVMSTVLKKKKPVVYGALMSKAADPSGLAQDSPITTSLKPQQKAALLPAQVPSVTPKSVLPKKAPAATLAPPAAKQTITNALKQPVTATTSAIAPPVPTTPPQTPPNIAPANPNIVKATTALQDQYNIIRDQAQALASSGKPIPPEMMTQIRDMEAKLNADQATKNQMSNVDPGILGTTIGKLTESIPGAPPEVNAQLEALAQQMLNPNLTDAQRQALRAQSKALVDSTGYVDPRIANPESGGILPPTMGKPATGGTPPSAVPTGETDASVTTEQPATPTINAESVYGAPDPKTAKIREDLTAQLKSLPANSPQRRLIEQQLAKLPKDYTELIAYDNSLLNNPPPGVKTPQDQARWQAMIKEEMDYFKGELAQYPDQYDKIFANHQKRMSAKAAEWESQGQYESQLTDLLNQAPPDLKVKIEELPSIQQNDLYRKAIEQYGQNPSPDQLAAKYAEMYPNGYDFSLDPAGFTPDKGTLDEYQKEFNYDPTQSTATINKTDTSGINTSGQTETGTKVTQAEIDALNKELGAQPLTEEEKNKILAGDFASIDADKQAAIKAAVSLGAASGWTKNLATVVNATAGTAQRYDIEKAKMRGELTRQNLAEVQARRSAAIAGLGNVAAREAGIAGTQAEAGLGAAEIGSRENIAEGELQLAKDTLYQQGKLTSLGMKIDENIKAYGLKLEKYQTDQGFDLALMEKDLKERIANQTGDMAAAELQAKNITSQIQAGMEERRIDDTRAAEIANLEQRAASGDVEAKNRTTQLRVETELRKLQLDNDWSQFVGQVLYNWISGRENLDQRRAEFLESIRQYEESKGGGGFGSILGSIAGTLGGSLLGPVGTIVGTWAGNRITGQKPKKENPK